MIGSSVLKEKLGLTRQRRKDRILGLNDLLKDLMDLKWQSWVTCGMGKEEGKIEHGNLEAIFVPAWVGK